MGESRVKIKKGMTVLIDGRFPCRLWRRNNSGPYLEDKCALEIEKEFTVVHVAGPYLGLAARNLRCLVDLREVDANIEAQ